MARAAGGDGRGAAGRVRRRQAWAAGMLVVAAPLALAACGGGTVVTPNATYHINSNGHSGTVEFHHGGGSYRFGATVPSGFPSSVPLPSGAQLKTATATTGQRGSVYELEYDVSGSVSSVVARYDQALSKAGFSSSTTISGSGSVLQGWEDAANNVEVETTPPSGGSTNQPALLIIVSPAGPSGSTGS